MSSTVKRLVVINWHFNLYTSELVLCSSICDDYHRLSSSSVVSVLRENDSGLQLRRHKTICGSEHQVPSCLWIFVMSSEHNAVVQLRLKATSPETKKKNVFANSPKHCFILLCVMLLKSSKNYLSVSRKKHDANLFGHTNILRHINFLELWSNINWCNAKEMCN